MSFWIPAKTANGWLPKFNPSGTRIVYGYCETHCCDLRTMEEFSIGAPPGKTGRLANLGFVDDDTLIAATIDGGQAIYRIRLTTDGLTTWWTYENLGLNSADATGSFGDANDGSWAFSKAAPYAPSSIVMNGKFFIPTVPLDHGYLYGAKCAGDHLLTSNHEELSLHYQGTKLVRTFPAMGGGYVNSSGDVGLGYYGPSYCAPWGQGLIDVTLTPWRQESAPFPIRVNGELWLWSAAADDSGQPIVFGRRLGETVPILVEGFEACGVAAAWNGSEFLVAGNTDKGILRLARVPMTAARKAIAARPDVAKFDHPMWSGYFYQWSDKYGDNPSAPGNCSVVVEPDVWKRCPTSVITATNALAPVERTVATWVSGGNVDEVEAEAAKARALCPARPCIGYLDRGTWDRVPRNVDWFGVQTYCGATETLTQFEQRIRQQIALLSPHGKIALVVQDYDTNDTLTRDLVSLQAVYVRLARDKNVVAVLRFSDGRALADNSRGGTRVHPELYPHHRAFDAAIPGTPAIETAAKAPEVTIVSFIQTVEVGQPARAVAKLTTTAGPADTLTWYYAVNGKWNIAAVNPSSDLDHSYKFAAPGDYDIAVEAKGPGGANRTWMPRTIHVTAVALPPEPDPVPEPEPVPAPTPPTPVPTPTPTPPKPKRRRAPSWWPFPESWWVF